jgi:ubiquinone/menaquinone biosynthesis C-methylase UbiE
VGLAPTRRHGVEILDDPTTPAAVRKAAMSDVARSNSLFGGTRAALRALQDVFGSLSSPATLLDVGTGLGDIPAAAVRAAARRGMVLTVIGLDVSAEVLRAKGRAAALVAANATRLPTRSASIDIVTCSQLLHHFREPEAIAVIAELHRVSRGWVVVSDLRRSRLAAAGFWLASLVLGFHPVTRHDGVASVFRGFTESELRRLIVEATGVEPRVRRGVFWRISATWRARA